MLKRVIYWRTYRKISQATKIEDFQTALELAKRINDRELIKWLALARITQLLRESLNEV